MISKVMGTTMPTIKVVLLPLLLLLVLPASSVGV
jgi:hypothetical protein